ncbi:MAG: AAA family ATPase [Candidatus Hadarchaeota archaeon]|nr:AAA family ATPase [Candidatus Hadarchaeota archaeon]
MHEFAVIGVVGLPGSGKTEIARVAGELDIPRVRMGDVVWDEVRERELELNEENVGTVARELRDKEGLDAIAKRCVPLIEEKGKNKKAVLVDGIRGKAEVEEFRRSFGERFSLLTVKASERTRFKRVSSRGRKDDISSLKAFHEKDERELSWGLDGAMNLADYSIVNEGTLGEFHQQAKEILKKIVGE